MTSRMILWYWQYFQKIRTVQIKGTFFHRFDRAVDTEPWKLKNTLICQKIPCSGTLGAWKLRPRYIFIRGFQYVLKRPWKFLRDLTTACPFVPDLAHRAPGPHVGSGAWDLTLRRPLRYSWHIGLFFSSHGSVLTAFPKRWKNTPHKSSMADFFKYFTFW